MYTSQSWVSHHQNCHISIWDSLRRVDFIFFLKKTLKFEEIKKYLLKIQFSEIILQWILLIALSFVERTISFGTIIFCKLFNKRKRLHFYLWSRLLPANHNIINGSVFFAFNNSCWNYEFSIKFFFFWIFKKYHQVLR